MRNWILSLLIFVLAGTGVALAQGTENVKNAKELTAEAWMLLGNQYFAEGAFDAAFIAYKQAVQKEPNNPRALYGLGRVQLRLGLLNPAIENLKRAIALDSQYLPTYLALAEAYLQLANESDDENLKKLQLSKALSVLNDAKKIAPEDPAVYNLEGLIREAMGDHARAIQAFKKAVELDPKNARAHYNLALAYLSQGKLDEAIAALEEAVKAAPENSYLRARLGALLAVKGELDRAEEVLTEAVRMDPKNSLAWDYLGQVRLKKGDYAGAIAALKKAVELAPLAYPEAYFYLGQAYLELGDAEKARFYLTKAVVLASKNADYRYWLGVANEKLGDLEGARAQYQEALKLDPEHKKAKEALARLQQ